MALTPKQQRFVEEYLVDFNATKAALRAGYAKKSAHSIGHENLSKPEIAEAIAKRQGKLSEKAGVTVERVLQEMAKLAFGDTTGVFDESGALKLPSEWTPEQAAAIASVEFTTKSLGEGEVKHVAKIKQWDKAKALEMLARHLGMFNDKLNITGIDNLSEKLRKGRERAKRS